MQSRPTRNYATKYKQIGFCLVLLTHSNLEIVTEQRNASIAPRVTVIRFTRISLVSVLYRLETDQQFVKLQQSTLGGKLITNIT